MGAVGVVGTETADARAGAGVVIGVKVEVVVANDSSVP